MHKSIQAQVNYLGFYDYYTAISARLKNSRCWAKWII